MEENCAIYFEEDDTCLKLNVLVQCFFSHPVPASLMLRPSSSDADYILTGVIWGQTVPLKKVRESFSLIHMRHVASWGSCPPTGGMVFTTFLLNPVTVAWTHRPSVIKQRVDDVGPDVVSVVVVHITSIKKIGVFC